MCRYRPRLRSTWRSRGAADVTSATAPDGLVIFRRPVSAAGRVVSRAGLHGAAPAPPSNIYRCETRGRRPWARRRLCTPRCRGQCPAWRRPDISPRQDLCRALHGHLSRLPTRPRALHQARSPSSVARRTTDDGRRHANPHTAVRCPGRRRVRAHTRCCGRPPTPAAGCSIPTRPAAPSPARGPAPTPSAAACRAGRSPHRGSTPRHRWRAAGRHAAVGILCRPPAPTSARPDPRRAVRRRPGALGLARSLLRHLT